MMRAYRYNLNIDTGYSLLMVKEPFCPSSDTSCGELVMLQVDHSLFIKGELSEDLPTRLENILFTAFVRSYMSTR